MELLTVREVARLIKLSSRQVYKLSAMGSLPRPVKLGRSTRWREVDIATFVANGCRMDAAAEGARP